MSAGYTADEQEVCKDSNTHHSDWMADANCQIADEEVTLHLEDYDSMQEQLEALLNDHLGEFPDDDKSEVASHAAEITRAHITDDTRKGHSRCVLTFRSQQQHPNSSRIIKAYIIYHMRRDSAWDPKAVTRHTPYHIRAFIMQKCGDPGQGYEGRKVSNVLIYCIMLADM